MSRSRTGRARGCLLIAALVLTLCASACGFDGSGTSQQESGCGKCSDEVADLRSQVARIAGVAKVDRLIYARHVALTTPATLTIQVLLDSRDPAPVTERIARLAWQSRVRPIERLAIDYGVPGDQYSRTKEFDFKDDATDYEQKWGSRPSG